MVTTVVDVLAEVTEDNKQDDGDNDKNSMEDIDLVERVVRIGRRDGLSHGIGGHSRCWGATRFEAVWSADRGERNKLPRPEWTMVRQTILYWRKPTGHRGFYSLSSLPLQPSECKAETEVRSSPSNLMAEGSSQTGDSGPTVRAMGPRGGLVRTAVSFAARGEWYREEGEATHNGGAGGPKCNDTGRGRGVQCHVP